MYTKYYTSLFLITFIKSLTIVHTQIGSEQQLNSLLEYDELSQKDSDGLRKRFLKNKFEKQKVRILDQLSNDTIYEDGIPYVDIDKFVKQKDKINEMEKGFKALLGMKGVKYTYKRGYHWRTWREIDYDGNKTITCYRCSSAINETCKNCLSGYWVIEEKPPPCPYEILSMPNDNQLCAVHFNQFIDFPSSCPTLINLSDLLATCNNPIETEWKITRKYNDLDSEPTLNVICGGRESCEILTLYTILPNFILFKIVNSTDHIIYSRMMRSGNKNYVCVEDCGIIDRKTKAIMKNEKPVVVNLLGSISHKNKREDITGISETIPTTSQNISSFSPKILLFISKRVQYNFDKDLQAIVTDDTKSNKDWLGSDPTGNKLNSVTKTVCKKLQDAFNNEDDSDTKETFV